MLKSLGYQAKEVLNRTVHFLMPLEIAIAHDKFWNRFKDSGIPSVLEQ